MHKDIVNDLNLLRPQYEYRSYNGGNTVIGYSNLALGNDNVAIGYPAFEIPMQPRFQPRYDQIGPNDFTPIGPNIYGERFPRRDPFASFNPQPFNPQPFNPQLFNPQAHPQPFNPQPFNPQAHPQPPGFPMFEPPGFNQDPFN